LLTTGVLVKAVALLSLGGEGPIAEIGLVTGVVASLAMMYYNIRRAADLQYTDGDWPGPKSWPAGMTLISFFALCAFLQALVADFSTPVVV
jgi:hypothetical protein